MHHLATISSFAMIALVVALVAVLLTLLERPLISWWASRHVASLVRKQARGERPPVSLERSQYGQIELSNGGMVFRKEQEAAILVPWAAISQIAAFKRDQFTTDLICLAVEFLDAQGQPAVLELHEEMVGFKLLMDELPQHFPLGDEEWWSKVAFPAFETNWTVVWKQANQPC